MKVTGMFPRAVQRHAVSSTPAGHVAVRSTMSPRLPLPSFSIKPPRKALLLVGGAFNPIHIQHVEMLKHIKHHLEKIQNIRTVAGFLVPSTDEYVFWKQNERCALKFCHRRKLCQLVAKDLGCDDWLCVTHKPYISTEFAAHFLTQPHIFDLNFGCHRDRMYDTSPIASNTDDIDASSAAARLTCPSQLEDLLIVHCLGADVPYWKCFMKQDIHAAEVEALDFLHVAEQAKTGKKVVPTNRHTMVIGRQGCTASIRELMETQLETPGVKAHIGRVQNSDENEAYSYFSLPHFTFLDTELPAMSSTHVREFVMSYYYSNRTAEKQRLFRANLDEKLSPAVTQYIIENIDDLWMSNDYISDIFGINHT